MTRSIGGTVMHGAALGLALAALRLPAAADLPPVAYAGMQRAAPEVLRVKALTVSRAKKGAALAVTARARVVKVTRTATGLKPGAVVTLRYEYRPLQGGMGGPAPIPVLKPGRVYPAWLRPDGNKAYAAAAMGKTFGPAVPWPKGAASAPPGLGSEKALGGRK